MTTFLSMPYCVVETIFDSPKDKRCIIIGTTETKSLVLRENIGHSQFARNLGGNNFELRGSTLDVVNDLEKFGWKVVSMQRSDGVFTDPDGATGCCKSKGKGVPFVRYTWTLGKA